MVGLYVLLNCGEFMEGREECLLRGCIKGSKGPWLVRRRTRDGGIMIKYRFLSERERLMNKNREWRRRSVAHNIFAGLRAHGNYKLPKNADSNDLLMALCEEAGWHVEGDGEVWRKSGKVLGMKDDDLKAIYEPDTTLKL